MIRLISTHKWIDNEWENPHILIGFNGEANSKEMVESAQLEGGRVSQMAQLTFQLDAKSEATLEKLMKTLGSPSKAAALRSALAVADVVADEIEDNAFTLKDKSSKEDVRVKLLGVK